MSYILCEFTYGLTGQFYQEIDGLGNVVRVTDLNGNTIDTDVVYCAIVIDTNPTPPSWAN